MDTIVFPSFNESLIKRLYWDIHVQFNINLFAHCKWSIQFSEDLKFIGNSYEVLHRGKVVLFDFGDSSEELPHSKNYELVFKTHVDFDKAYSSCIRPWSPVSFYNWVEQEELSRSIIYDSRHLIILNNQQSYGNSIKRRDFVKSILKNSGFPVDFEITPQKDYWYKVGLAKVCVLVPGNRNNMTDRSHLQLWSFGCPVISPHLPEVFPYNKRMISGYNYIQVNDDYSNLTEVLTSLNADSFLLEYISKNVKSRFQEIFTPPKLIGWFLSQI